MGFNVVLTPKDLAVGQPIPTNWYPLEITDAKFEVTKGSAEKPSDGSENLIYEFTVVDGPEGVTGRKLRRFFNEKVMGFAGELFAVLFPENFDAKKGGNVTTEMMLSVVGRKLDGYVQMDGKFPTIAGYRPSKK